MKIAANLSMFYTHVPLLQRYELAARAGFRLVEVSLPYAETASSLREAADKHGLKHVLINAPVGDWAAGDRGVAAIPGRKAEFVEGIEKAIDYATSLDCKLVHVMAGVPDGGSDHADAVDTFLHNIRHAAGRLAQYDIMCLIEPINHYTVPGYFLHTYDQALDVISKVDMPNVKIQYDVFHAQQICGQITTSIESLRHLIGHIQIAQVPSRHGPATPGEIDYKYLFPLLSRVGANEGWVIGCEYTPEQTDDVAKWAAEMGVHF